MLLAAQASMLVFQSQAVADALRVTLAQDIALGSWAGSGDKVGTSDACIYRLLGSGYAITATGSGGSFALTSGANSIPFDAAFKASSGTGGTYTALPYNTTRTFSGADETSETCSGGYNANVRVTALESALGEAPAGSYTGTLIITLTAN